MHRQSGEPSSGVDESGSQGSQRGRQEPVDGGILGTTGAGVMAFDWRQPSSRTGSWQALHRARGAGMSYEEWLESRMGTEGGAHEAGRKSGLCEQLGRECAAGSPQGWHDGEGTEGWPGGEWFSPCDGGAPWESNAEAIQRSAMLQSGWGKRWGMRRRFNQC